MFQYSIELKINTKRSKVHKKENINILNKNSTSIVTDFFFLPRAVA